MTSLVNNVSYFPNQPRRDDKTKLRGDEIGEYTKRLKDYQIEMSHLPNLTPTDPDIRQNAIHVARTIAESNQLRTLFLKTKTLPIHELVKQASVRKELLERYSTYITAMTLLFMKDYPHLMAYLHLSTT